MTYGFEGDPHAFLTTAEVAARLGYNPDNLKRWYNDAPKRRAQNFPQPIRKGYWRLGDLQDWAARKGAPSTPRPTPAPRPELVVSNPDPVQPDPIGARPEVLERLNKLAAGR